MNKLFFLIFFFAKAFAMDLESHMLQEETTVTHYFRKPKQEHVPCNFKHIDYIYVLNLQKRPEKWKSTIEKLSHYDIRAHRFEAIDGWKIPEETLYQFWKEQRQALIHDRQTPFALPPSKLTQGSLGNLLSHLSAIQDAYDQGYQCIWVLEDDIDIRRDPKLLDIYLEKLFALDPQWDILFTDLDKHAKPTTWPLAGSYRKNQQVLPDSWYAQRKSIDDDFQEVRFRQGFYSAILSRSGMEKILHYYKHVALYSPMDIDIHFIQNLHKYALKDPVVTHIDTWTLSDCLNNVPCLKDFAFPYNQLKRILPYTTCQPHPNEPFIQDLLSKYQPKTAFALTASLGQSLFNLAKHLPSQGHFYVVDTWDTISYEQLLSNSVQMHLFDVIIPWKMSTKEALGKACQVHLAVDFVYLNSSIDKEDLYQELCRWYSILQHRGMLCFDDFSWKKDPSLEKVVGRFSHNHNVQILFPNYSFWILVKRD